MRRGVPAPAQADVCGHRGVCTSVLHVCVVYSEPAHPLFGCPEHCMTSVCPHRKACLATRVRRERVHHIPLPYLQSNACRAGKASTSLPWHATASRTTYSDSSCLNAGIASTEHRTCPAFIIVTSLLQSESNACGLPSWCNFCMAVIPDQARQAGATSTWLQLLI